MAEFKSNAIDVFLGVIRKYMQMRGALSQKDLAEKTETGVSTMSRFLNKKTHDLDPNLIAKIVAKLDIPLVEIIDFVEENYWDKFRRTVDFYKAEEGGKTTPLINETKSQINHVESVSGALEEALVEGLGTANKTTHARGDVGGKTHTIPFVADQERRGQFVEKITSLSPRQKAYVSDFLNLDAEGRDLMVDLGNSLFRYFRQKGVEF